MSGCGPGDVSFVAARLVGPTGTVLGVDAAPEMIELARARAAEQGLSAVHFERKPPLTRSPWTNRSTRWSAGLILMHLPDPAATLRHLSSLVRPGGVIAFSENDITGTRSIPELPLFGQVTAGIVARLRGDGAQSAVWHHPAHDLCRRRFGRATPDPWHADRYRRRHATSWPTPRKSGGWYPR